MSVFGKAKFGGNNRNWWKLKDGANGPYRILPPMGDLADDGIWHVFYSIHYGYKNSEGHMRTFVSPFVQNRNTKMVEAPDAALDRIDQLKKKLDDAKKAGDTNLVTKLLDLVGGKKSRYNLDSNHHMIAVDLQGNIGILKIRHRCKLALDAKIKELRAQGVEPLSPENGRYFTFTRSGSGPDTGYQISVYKQKLNIEGVGEVEKDVVHQITDELARRCVVRNKDGVTFTYKEAPNLATLFKRPSSEEVERIVREGEKAVDEILDAKNSGEVNTDESGLEDDDVSAAPSNTQDNQALLAAAQAAASTPQPVTQATPPTPTVSTATVATPAPVAAQATPPAQTGFGAPKTTAETVAAQTDEEFLKSLGI